MKPILHGENFLEPVSKAPKGKKTQEKEYIVGHSETGHHHVLKSATDFDVIDLGGETYIELKERGLLKHEKSFDIHEALTVEPGVYKVHHKTEYDPFNEVIRKVWD